MAANPAGVDARSVRLAALGVVLLALLPSVGTLDAPWIAEDASILAEVRADGPWADWTRGQYGLLLLRFWRPLVSTSWALQEATTGIAPVPLRLFNLALHALASVLVFACARRLGAGLAGAFVAGAWIALFPEQGGTSTWLAGRTDLLCAVPLLASAFTGLGGKPLLAAPWAFLACAAKEFGFLAPLWIALLALARGEAWREVLRRSAPAGVAAVLALAWRRMALGTFAGGYAFELPGLLPGLQGLIASTWSYNWASLFLLPPLLVLLARGPDRRLLGGVLGAWCLALVPLAPLLADGWLEPENRRLFYLAECVFALAAGVAWSRWLARAEARPRFALLALLYLGGRGALAWNDTHDWARSARTGEREIARVRAALAGARPGPEPVLFASFPNSRSGAYCLGFGLAARFRAPFPETPRPVWPWRLAGVPRIERERAPLVPARADGSIWPLDDPSGVAELALRTPPGEAVERIDVDERVFVVGEDRSPRLALQGPAGARFEAVLASEIGYEPFALGNLPADGAVAFSLRELLASSNGTYSGGGLLQQAADLRAGRAYLELRALAPDGRPLAATRWIELVWPPELLALSLGE
jgi:hypothetical protein